MDLQSASAWLERSHAGFTHIHEFAKACRDSAREGTRESAALALLAERAVTFTERYEGIAVATEVVDQFLTEIRKETLELAEASKASDAQLIKALNQFSARLAAILLV